MFFSFIDLRPILHDRETLSCSHPRGGRVWSDDKCVCDFFADQVEPPGHLGESSLSCPTELVSRSLPRELHMAVAARLEVHTFTRCLPHPTCLNAHVCAVPRDRSTTKPRILHIYRKQGDAGTETSRAFGAGAYELRSQRRRRHQEAVPRDSGHARHGTLAQPVVGHQHMSAGSPRLPGGTFSLQSPAEVRGDEQSGRQRVGATGAHRVAYLRAFVTLHGGTSLHSVLAEETQCSECVARVRRDFFR